VLEIPRRNFVIGSLRNVYCYATLRRGPTYIFAAPPTPAHDFNTSTYVLQWWMSNQCSVTLTKPLELSTPCLSKSQIGTMPNAAGWDCRLTLRVFWDVTPCSRVDGYGRYGWTCCLRLRLRWMLECLSRSVIFYTLRCWSLTPGSCGRHPSEIIIPLLYNYRIHHHFNYTYPFSIRIATTGCTR
jgi:hypothetical protein